MNIGVFMIAIIGGFAGIVSTLYLSVSFPAVIIWKAFWKLRHGIPMTQ